MGAAADPADVDVRCAVVVGPGEDDPLPAGGEGWVAVVGGDRRQQAEPRPVGVHHRELRARVEDDAAAVRGVRRRQGVGDLAALRHEVGELALDQRRRVRVAARERGEDPVGVVDRSRPAAAAVLDEGDLAVAPGEGGLGGRGGGERGDDEGGECES